MRPWLRRERLVKIALTLPRSSACSAASRTASRCTWSKARATSPISSRLVIGIGCTRVSTRPGSVRESWSTSIGSRCWATSKAAVRSVRMLWLIERAIRPAMMNANSSATSTIAEFTSAFRRASEAISSVSATASRVSFDSTAR